MKIAYLEFVTPDVESVCAAYARVHGLSFGAPVPELGGARIANLSDGTRLGVRPPLRPDEGPVVRPYLAVEDVEVALDQAEAAGARVALSAMELPGHGVCGIFLLGGLECGLWADGA